MVVISGLCALVEPQGDDGERPRDSGVRRKCFGTPEECIGGAQAFRSVAVKMNLGKVDKRVRLIWVKAQRRFKLCGRFSLAIKAKENRAVIIAC